MLFFLIGFGAFGAYCLVLRLLFREYRYRWAVWLWALTFIIQLPFFFKWEWAWLLLCFMVDPFHTWGDTWHRRPSTALLLLLVPSVLACTAWGVQYRRYTQVPAPPSPPRPWVVPAMLVTYLTFLLLLVWWLKNG